MYWRTDENIVTRGSQDPNPNFLLRVKVLFSLIQQLWWLCGQNNWEKRENHQMIFFIWGHTHVCACGWRGCKNGPRKMLLPFLWPLWLWWAVAAVIAGPTEKSQVTSRKARDLLGGPDPIPQSLDCQELSPADGKGEIRSIWNMRRTQPPVDALRLEGPLYVRRNAEGDPVSKETVTSGQKPPWSGFFQQLNKFGPESFLPSAMHNPKMSRAPRSYNHRDPDFSSNCINLDTWIFPPIHHTHPKDVTGASVIQPLWPGFFQQLDKLGRDPSAHPSYATPIWHVSIYSRIALFSTLISYKPTLCKHVDLRLSNPQGTTLPSHAKLATYTANT